jgi:hypothetical protein
MRHAAELLKRLRRLLAVALVAIVGWVLLDYPLGSVWLTAGLLLYALLLWRYPFCWLFFIPALLPVLDLAPWTGWFFLDEFDLFVLVTLVVSLSKGHKEVKGQVFPRGAKWLISLFMLSFATSALIGLLPLQVYDANAFSNYYSNYNSLRVAKGFFWALTLIPLLQRELGEPTKIRKYLIPGMLVGLSGVVMVAIWERQVFSGFLNFSNDFRITSTFSGMHTGGAYIDAYLAAALPFIAACFLFWRSKAIYLFGLWMFTLGLYTLLVTFSRIDYLAFGLSFLTLFIGLAFEYARKKRLLLVGLVVVGVSAIVAVPVLQAPYIQKRFAKTARDAGVRLHHWGDAFRMMDSGWLTALFGMGLGSYPRTYALRNSEGVKPATYWYKTEGGNTYLRLASGDSLYIGQRIPLEPQASYTLKFDLRSSDDNAMLNIPICEKSLLHSFRCRWMGQRVGDTGGRWVHYEQTFQSGALGGQGNLVYQRRPVELALYNGKWETMVDVDNVQLIDRSGTDLVKNGDFSLGNDRWFFTIDNHLPWHIFNLWVHLIFEQGWIGFLLFNVLLLYVLTDLVIRIHRGDLFSIVLLSSVFGFLTVGLVGSLFDSPRIAMLFFFLIFVSILHSRKTSGTTFVFKR